MDKFLKQYLGLGLAAAGGIASLVVAYLIYREANKTPEQRAADKLIKDAEAKKELADAKRDAVAINNPNSLGYKNPISTIGAFLSGGLFIPPTLSGGPPVSVRGSILLQPDNKVVLVNDIVAQGGSIRMRADGTYDFRYNNRTYTMQEGTTRADGVRIANLRTAGATL